MSSCKQGQTCGSNITKEMLWWKSFCNKNEDYYKKRKCSKELFCASHSTRKTCEVESYSWQKHASSKIQLLQITLFVCKMLGDLWVRVFKTTGKDYTNEDYL